MRRGRSHYRRAPIVASGLRSSKRFLPPAGRALWPIAPQRVGRPHRVTRARLPV